MYVVLIRVLDNYDIETQVIQHFYKRAYIFNYKE